MSIALNNLPETPIASLGIGVFDGMHRGHQIIRNQSQALLTFHPHPDTILGKNTALKYLTTPEELHYYVDNLITLEFNRTVAKLDADAFLDQVILKKLAPQEIVVGYDFKFGKKGQGNLNTLKTWAIQHDISILEVHPCKYEGYPIKSSSIRTLLKSDFNQAIAQLGHPYLIIGTVEKGESRGKHLGFPTANIVPQHNKLMPSAGVYKGYVEMESETHPAIIYIGEKPTFSGSKLSLEVHLLDYSGSLYDKKLLVFIESFIRGEEKFNSEDALIRQIKLDIQSAYPDSD